MRFTRWVRGGYKVEVWDHANGKDVWMNVKEYLPGANIDETAKPHAEITFLISEDTKHELVDRLDSVVHGLMEEDEHVREILRKQFAGKSSKNRSGDRNC